MVRAGSGEVLRLAQAVREGERTQRPGAAGSLDRGLGAPAHHRLLRLTADPLDGYRRLTFMMLDEDVVALSPSTTYRVLSKAGRLDRWNGKPSKKGTGFVQPLRPVPSIYSSARIELD